MNYNPMLFTHNAMASTGIFIHVPKTGGNTVNQALLNAKLSLDTITISSPAQDGVERFDLKGEITRHKHMMLWEYLCVSPSLQSAPIISCVRRPFERIVSYYFSPHRHLYLADDGKIALKEEIEFSEEAFFELAQSLQPAAYYISRVREISSWEGVRKDLEKGMIHILRTETLDADFRNYFGFSIASHRRNVSPYKEHAGRVVASKELRELTENTHHKVDLELFYSDMLT